MEALPGTLIKALLVIVIIILAVMGLMFLRKRNLPPAGYLFWGMIAIVIPVFGPILLIALHPGQRRPSQH